MSLNAGECLHARMNMYIEYVCLCVRVRLSPKFHAKRACALDDLHMQTRERRLSGLAHKHANNAARRNTITKV